MHQKQCREAVHEKQRSSRLRTAESNTREGAVYEKPHCREGEQGSTVEKVRRAALYEKPHCREGGQGSTVEKVSKQGATV